MNLGHNSQGLIISPTEQLLNCDSANAEQTIRSRNSPLTSERHNAYLVRVSLRKKKAACFKIAATVSFHFISDHG
jgi:hypothetical protein